MRKPIYQTFDKRHEDFWSEFRDRYLEKHTESDIGYDINRFSEDDLKDIRAKANTHFANFVKRKLDEFIVECQEEGEIWKKLDYPYNRSWIVNDAGMKKTLKRYKKLLDVINFIDKEGRHRESIDVEGWATFKVNTKLGPEVRKYSHVIVGSDFFQRAKKMTGFPRITMQKYLQAFTRMGILQKIKQLKSHNRAMLYVDGCFRRLGEGGITKKDRFMNQKDHQQALRHFEY